MGDELQPGIHKPWCFGGSQDVEGIAADGEKNTGGRMFKIIVFI